MKRKVLIAVLCSLLLFFIAATFKDNFVNSPAHCWERVKKDASFLLGRSANENVYDTEKKLTYQLYVWSFFPIGTFTLSNKNTEDVYIYTGAVDSAGGFLHDIAPGSASCESTLDRKTGITSRFIETTSFKGNRVIRETFYDQLNNVAVRGDTRMKIPPDVIDPVAAFVRSLTVPWPEKKHEAIPFLSQQAVYFLKCSLTSSMEEVARIQYAIERSDGAPGRKIRFAAWVTTDDRRIPVLFHAWTPFGHLSIILKKIEETS